METEKQQQQYLVRFQEKTHVMYAPRRNNRNHGIVNTCLLQQVSDKTGWPLARLSVSMNKSFVSVRVVSCIVGGKGGFGTLLKGQSKQAGARLTTDFGACRDLQGRRLRHVNDEIKLRKWRDMQQRKAAGEQVNEIQELATPSGIANWHLMVPNWAADSLSKKATSKLQRTWERQIQQEQQLREKQEKTKLAKEQAQQQYISDYVQRTADASEKHNMADAIQEGLKQQKLKKQQESVLTKRKRNDNESNNNDSSSQKPQSLCTLSGDAVVVESKHDSFQIQSKSDFCTVALVLDPPSPQMAKSLYYEVKLETGGLAQIGWAYMAEFRPNSDTGDGVGDDASSYAHDGSRNLKFHDGTEATYGEKQKWKRGDVVGCRYHPASGVISYLLNGVALGVAFTTKHEFLVPAMSCNEGEILELVVKDMQYMPSDCVAVVDLVTSSLVDSNAETTETLEDKKQEAAPPRAATEEELTESKKQKTKPQASPKPKPTPVEIKHLDLENYQSVEELEELGLDRLKGALLALGVKCGGSLQERAARLFSLKGLQREEYPTKVRGKNFVV